MFQEIILGDPDSLTMKSTTHSINNIHLLWKRYCSEWNEQFIQEMYSQGFLI